MHISFAMVKLHSPNIVVTAECPFHGVINY